MPTAIPTLVRRVAYLFFIIVGLALACTFIVFAVYGEKSPLWFVAALAVYAFLSPYGHSIALGNVPPMGSVSMPSSLLASLGFPSNVSDMIGTAKQLTATPATTAPTAATPTATVTTPPA